MAPYINLTGRIFLELTVIERVPAAPWMNRRIYWRCRCSCGNEHSVRGSHLLSGKITSCGCRRDRMSRERSITHGRSKTIEYDAWCRMISRCENPKNPKYHRYGARGIRVCPRWRYSFLAFLEDMGPRPSRRHSLERKDNDGDYTPDNCIWALPTVQSNNTSRNHRLTFNGQTLTLTQWAAVTGIRPLTLQKRAALGWPVADILTIPARIGSNQYLRNR